MSKVLTINNFICPKKDCGSKEFIQYYNNMVHCVRCGVGISFEYINLCKESEVKEESNVTKE